MRTAGRSSRTATAAAVRRFMAVVLEIGASSLTLTATNEPNPQTGSRPAGFVAGREETSVAVRLSGDTEGHTHRRHHIALASRDAHEGIRDANLRFASH